MVAVTRYVVHARRFAGSLAEPTRNDIQSAGSDDLGAAVSLAEDMARRGWATWVFEDHADGPAEPGFGPRAVVTDNRYRVVGEWRADGRRVR